MILTINGKTIQTFGAHRLVQGENRPEPITFRVTMPKASEMSWYLGYKRQDGTGEEAVALEASQASGNVDDLYLTWYPSRTATHVPGKLGIIVYGLQANVTPEGGDRRWSTYPTQLIIAQGQTVESAEPVDPSVFEQALIDLTALVEQALGIKTDVQALKEEAGAYLAQIITLASEVEANAINVAALEGSAKSSAESAAESATEAGRKATIAETASNMASESASRANEKAGDASASATLAREYKNDAQSSAENAQAGARAAEQSASSAQESAERAERVGIEADRVIAEVEAVGEEKKQQITTEAEEKIGEIIAEGESQVEAVRGVYQEDLSRLTSHLTDLSEDTYRKAEVDSKVAEATPSDYASLKNKVTNLEYENRITKAVLAKKIAEETEATGTVIPFPSTGDEGYPLAEWGELKRLKGESLVWSQLVADNKRSGRATNTPYQITTLASRIPANHVVFAHANMKSDGVCYISLWGVTPLKLQPSDSFAVWEGCIKREIVTDVYIQYEGGGTYAEWEGAFCVDMTSIFGITNVEQVTESMKTFVRQYATAHPQYDAGSLVSAVYERGVSVGKNLFDGVCDKYFLHRNDRIEAYANYPRCKVFKVTEGEKYAMSGDFSNFNSSVIRVFYTVDEPAVGVTSSGYTVGVSGTVFTVPTGMKYMCIQLEYNTPVTDWKAYNIQVERSDRATEYSPYYSQTLDLSFLNSVEDIGIEGTVIDFERETVEWKYGKIDMGTLAWAYDTQYTRFTAPIPTKKKQSDVRRERLPNTRYSDITDGRGVNEVPTGCIYSGTTNEIFVVDTAYTNASTFKASLNGVILIYELATPITRSFSDLGIVIPSDWDGGKPWIRVEAGGKFTVVSSGAEAEATVSFVTDLRRA